MNMNKNFVWLLMAILCWGPMTAMLRKSRSLL